MIRGRLRDGRTGAVLVEDIGRTTTMRERTVGLLVLPPLQQGQGLLLDRCWSIHTWFMRYRIDIVYLDRYFKVCKQITALSPWRMSTCVRAAMTLELCCGAIESTGLQIAQQLEWEPI